MYPLIGISVISVHSGIIFNQPVQFGSGQSISVTISLVPILIYRPINAYIGINLVLFGLK